MHSISHTFTYVWQYSKIETNETIKKHGCQAQTPLKKDVNHHLRFVLWLLALYKFVYVMYMHTAVKAGLSERMKKHVLMPLSWKDWERFCKFCGQKRKQSWSKAGTVGYCRSKEASILWSHYEETRELSGERDVARNNAMCMQARKTNAMYWLATWVKLFSSYANSVFTLCHRHWGYTQKWCIQLQLTTKCGVEINVMGLNL